MLWVTEEKTVDNCFFKDVTELRRNEARLCRARISTIFREGRAKQFSLIASVIFNLIFRGVAQLVARVLWEHDAAGSNPVTPTKKALGNQSQSLFFVSSDANFEG